MILLIDNYDSFVHNLARYFRMLGRRTKVVRNDQADIDRIAGTPPCAIVISPGPCTPDQAGMSLALVERLAHRFPILGVCLGHQVIAQAFGGRIVRAREPMHGRASQIYHDQSKMFRGIGIPFSAARYHSLIVQRDSMPLEIAVTAWADDGTVMAIQHRELPVVGLQFHPESILTGHGLHLLQNFLDQFCGVASKTLSTSTME